MKKFLSSILVFSVLIVSIFSIGAFADGTTKTEALLDKLNTSKEVTVTLRTGSENVFGLSNDIKNTVYVKNDKLAYDLDNGKILFRAVVKDSKIIGFLPSFPYLYAKISSPLATQDYMWGIIKNLSNITMGVLYFVGSKTEQVDGVEYYVEEFNDRQDVTSKFYYVGDELKILRVEDTAKKTVQYTYFDEILFSVDDSVFDVPVIAIDITPILKMLAVYAFGSIIA